MKKSILFLSIILILSLGGCKSLVTSKSNKKGSSDETVITYARGVDPTEATAKLVEEFNRLNKGKIRVEFREMPYATDLQHDEYIKEFSENSSDIDVFDADVVWPAEFADSNYALALDEYIEKDGIDKKAYLEGPMAAVTFKGKTWGLPKFVDAGLLFYRSDIIEEVPETWDDLIKMADKYQGAKGTTYGYLAQAKKYEGLVCNAMELIAAYGGEVVDWKGGIVINQPQTVRGLKKFIDLLNQPFVPLDITSYTEVESHTKFINGESVFIRNWPYQWGLANNEDKSKIAGKVGVAPLPIGTNGGAATLGGWVTMINRNSKNPEAAWEFLKFMNGPKGQKISAIYAGQAPTLNEVWEDEEVLDANPFFRSKGFKLGLKYAVPRPVSPVYPELSEIMQDEIFKAIDREISPAQAVENMEIKMKEVVENNK
ncbi:MAG: ABC transporter substrate-binding protein [Fusobacteriota bacterium]